MASMPGLDSTGDNLPLPGTGVRESARRTFASEQSLPGRLLQSNLRSARYSGTEIATYLFSRTSSHQRRQSLPYSAPAMSTPFLHSLRRVGTSLVIFAALVGFVLSSAPGFAIGPGSGPGGKTGGDKDKGRKITIPPPGPGGGGPPPPPPPPITPPIPEISPGSAASALMLLAGGTLILTDRLRRRPAPPAAPAHESS